MKQIFDKDMDLADFKKMVKGMQRKNGGFCTALLAFLGIITLACIAAFCLYRVIKKNDDEFYLDDYEEGFEGECDENGCYYTDDNDFAE